MRIITRRKIYRAFPELDSFSDNECEGLLERVRLTKWRVARMHAAVAIAGVTGLFAASFTAVRFLAGVDVRRIEVELILADQEWVFYLYGAGLMFIVIALPSVLGLLTRDVMLGRFLEQALRGHLKRTVCPSCRYQLLGLRVDEAGVVRCPECGRETALADLGLDGPEDLRPAPASQTVS